MERKKASDFPPEVLKLFDGYVHGRINRRDFLDEAAKFAVGGFTAAAMLRAEAELRAWVKDDPRIKPNISAIRRRRARGRCADISPGWRTAGKRPAW
jgi:carboxymethylenebutenolidase